MRPGASNARFAPLTSTTPRSLAANKMHRASGERRMLLSPPSAIARLATFAKPAIVGAPWPSSDQATAHFGSLDDEGSKSLLIRPSYLKVGPRRRGPARYVSHESALFRPRMRS